MIPAVAQAGAVILILIVVFTAVGRAVLAWCTPAGRPLSAAALAGAAAIVVWLVTISPLVPPGSPAGVASLAVAIAALLAATFRYRPGALRPSRGETRTFVAVVLAGVACTTPILLIVAQSSSTAVVHLSGNHDAFFFTAVPRWLMSHRSFGGPNLTSAGSPDGTALVGSAWDFFQRGSVRIGFESLLAALARVTGVDPRNLWLPVTMTLHVLVVAGIHQAAVQLWRPGRWAVGMAATVGTSSLLLSATVDQHTPTLLAMAFAFGLLAELTRALRWNPTDQRPGGRWSPVLVALMLSGIVAAYGELLVLLGLPLLFLAIGVARAANDGRRAELRRWCITAGWCAAFGSMAWVRSFQAITRSQPPTGYPQTFGADQGLFPIIRSLALGRFEAYEQWGDAAVWSRLLVTAFALALLVGLTAVFVRGRAAVWWVTLAAVTLIGWWVLGQNDGTGYPQERFINWAMPFLLLGALIGWAALLDGGTAPKRRPVAVAAMLALAVLVLPGIISGAQLKDDPARRIDDDFAMTADWVHQRDASGAHTVVWAQSYLTNLWTAYVLQGAGRTSYLSIYKDYFNVTSFGPLTDRRWLLLDKAALETATLTPRSLAEVNARFSLVDLRVGPATVVVPPAFHGRWSALGVPVTVTFTELGATCTTGSTKLPCA